MQCALSAARHGPRFFPLTLTYMDVSAVVFRCYEYRKPVLWPLAEDTDRSESVNEC
jgi:hypothetical protein